MKKILSILFSILTLTVMAQVPQGVGYQGVATDANGIELVNQSISIKASVLSGSASGTIEWEETHATSTDTFGLFTITIGQGTTTGNGVQADFADISWGINTYFLKIEMDVNGGTNYAFMGTNQMMSVPYALYAESANINYDSISNFLSGDSTFITNVGSGMGGGGCDYAFPEGLDGDPISHDLVSNSYTVPNGKNLYITHLWAYGGSGYLDVYVDGIPISTGQVGTEVGRLNNSIVVSSGQIVSTNHVFTGAAGFGVSFNGFLVDKIINPITHNLLVSNSYTVPSGKNLYITHLWSYGSAGYLDVYIDGILINSGQLGADAGSNGYTGRLNNLIIASSGQVVSTSHVFTGATNFGVNFNGYIADDNYFAGCGGGGSSSTSSLDSTAIANMIAGSGGGCNYNFPEGLDGDRMIINLGNGNYTVPSGKKLYMTSLKAHNLGATYYLQLNNNIFDLGPSNDNPVIAQSGDIISVDNYSPNDSYSQVTVFGFLIDDPNNVQRMIINLGIGNYTVPSGKKLYMTSLKAHDLGATYYLQLNNNMFDLGGANDNPVIAQSGDIISVDNYSPNGTNSQVTVFGYLADENYFAGCGGGGSSTTSSLDSTAIANMIAAAGGGCNFNYPDGLNGTPVIHDFIANGPYTVPAGKNFYTNMIYNNNSDDILINSLKIHDSGTMNSSLNTVLSEGDVISMTYNGGNTPPHKNMFGMLVDKKVQSLSYDFLANGAYTVPAGKELYIYRIFHVALSVQVNSLELADGTLFTSNQSSQNNHIILKAGDVIDIIDQGSGGFENMFGYLADENYFAGCGGDGGSSSSSSLDSTAIANMIASAVGNPCNFKHPEGYNGDGISTQINNSSTYTVPSGKRLYITHAYGINQDLVISGVGTIAYSPGSDHVFGLPIIMNSSQQIQSNSGNININGYLVDENPDVEGLSVEINNSSTYTVPSAKRLYITHAYGVNADLIISGVGTIAYSPGSDHVFSMPIIINAGQQIQSNSGNININGYLVDETFFQNCQ